MKPINSEKTTRNTTSGFESPINFRPSLLVPPIEAKTPDLFESEYDKNKTPVLCRSLGVQHDLDVSWCSDMATPQNPNRLPCPKPPNVTPDLGIKKITDGCNVVDRLSGHKQTKNILAHNQTESPLIFDDIPLTRQKNQYIPSNQALENVDITSLFMKRNSSFIYPEPVKIQITPQRPMAFSNNAKNPEVVNGGEVMAEFSPLLLSQRRRKHPKEIRKSLKFVADASGNSFENSSVTDNSYSFGNEEDMLECETGSIAHHTSLVPEKLATNQFAAKDEASIDFVVKESNEVFGKFKSLAAFATASGKNVSVSNESLARAKALLEEEASTPVDFPFNETENPQSVGHREHLTVTLPISSTLKPNQEVSEAIGFSTASGKNLAISDKAITRAKQLFDDLEEDCQIPTTHHLKTKIDQLSIIPSERRIESKQSFAQETASPSVGFITAGGKKLNVSTEAIQRAQKVFDSINNEDTISEHDRALLKEPSHSTDRPLGFQTATGRSVKVSEEALQRAKKMFEDTQDEDKSVVPTTKRNAVQPAVGLQYANEKKTAISEDGLKKAGTLLDVGPKTAESSTKGIGFSTASGRKVPISKEALNRARTLFVDTDFEVHHEVNVQNTRNNTVQAVDKKNLQAFGFSTAGGKQVVVSETALARAKKLFEETEEEAGLSKQTYDCKSEGILNTRNAAVGLNKSVGTSEFSIADGKSVTVSENALTRAKKRLDETEEVRRPIKTDSFPEILSVGQSATKIVFEANKNSGISGFSTAGGKNVMFSEKAFARARKLFDDEEAALLSSIVSASSSEMKSESISSHESTSESTSSRKRKIGEENPSEEEETWISSPTIGKKRKKNLSPKLPSTPISGTPLSAFDNAPTCVSSKVLVLRRKAREQQKSLIELKRAKKVRVVQKPGTKYGNKSMPRSTMKQLIDQLPKSHKPYELLNNYGVLPSVCLVTAANANSFNFFAWEHFSVEECRSNASGFQTGCFNVILSDDNIIGCDEIASSLLASENVDPNLINVEWIRNHYRWIVWKLAALELRVPRLFARNSLTLLNVLEQLKYRYDVEVDNCKRSALKRIIEQDDTAAKTMVLCVAQIRSNTVLELTDGWYGLDAHCDSALSQLIENGKVFVGVKLLISGAELVAPGPSTPLEKGSDTYLKISANSTRRAKWDLKLGFFKKPQPFPVTLKSILPEGGLVSHTKVIIARTYPVVYMEKAADGKTVFHSERHYRRMSEGMASKYERIMEQVVETIEREEEEQDRKRSRSGGTRYQNLTDEEKRIKIQTEARKRIEKTMLNMTTKGAVPLLKLRVIDRTSPDLSSAIVSVWRPTEELQSYLKEGRCYHLYNVNAAGLRFGELQLNSVKHTVWKEIKNEEFSLPENLPRTITSFEIACQPSFKPTFNELDLVGLVVYVGEQQVKGPFQTIVLSDGYRFFGIKCWSSLEEYSLAEVVKTGTFLAFSNLQWRTTASRTTSRLPVAFIHEATIVSSRPALKHIASALDELKKNITDVAACVSEAEEQVLQLVGNTTPQSATPRFGSDLRRSAFTPSGTSAVDGGKDTPTSTNPTVARARLLEKYGNPPALSPLNNVSSPHVRQKFKPPARKSLA